MIMNKYCPICETAIQQKSKQWKKQIYCSTKCRKVAHRKRLSKRSREEQKRANLLQNDEVLYLVRQCRRAGTVQILSGHDSKSFIETMALIRNRPKANMHLCHIEPVSGQNSVGLLHAKNLFWGGAYQNQRLGNKILGKGLSIKRNKLLEHWKISKELPTNEILIKIEEYLGGIVADYINESPIRKSKKAQIAQKIIQLKPQKNLELLMKLSHTKLLEEWAKLNSATPPRHSPQKSESKYIYYIDELTRFISYKSKNSRDLRRLRKALIFGYIALERLGHSRTYNKDFKSKYGDIAQKFKHAKLRDDTDWSEFKDLIYNTSFMTLQGARLDIKKIYKEIKGYLNFSKSAPFA
ncbi:TPA: hypothetical protein N0H14_004570 [Pseudomonas aeruginosa]|nr:hypothetical protein [Pseudomonas aeruginosa]HCK4590444.1 hypothetical protein [Pseudomonas aeruginosa]